MEIEWYGQSAFKLTGDEATVVIDPFGDMSAIAGRGITWEYPPIEDVDADVLLITHEHGDHNAAEVVGGEPHTLRSTAGRLESPIGEVLAVSSEHDEAAGTERGHNTIFVFELDGLRVAHFGDFGQAELRDEQAEAIGTVDLLFVPVGAGPTIGAEQAAEIARRLEARWVVPMHYRTERIGFLEPADEFIALADRVHRANGPSLDTSDLPEGEGLLVVVPAAP
ncbi:MAG TPA: MBL fold metallo-hydrolase [Solirubrobacteraceae bacterium]|nr:MBL fold metallo-hydrolase [Solirubrobacteraceae bacterium]